LGDRILIGSEEIFRAKDIIKFNLQILDKQRKRTILDEEKTEKEIET
jgi:hypothetical protein